MFQTHIFITPARDPNQAFWEISEVGAAGLGWTEKVTKIVVLYSRNARDPLFCVRPVKVGVRKPCFLQQMREGDQLEIGRGITHWSLRKTARTPTV